MIDSDGAGMPEIVVWYFLGVQFMNSHIDVEVGLQVILHFSRPLELLCCPSQTVGQRSIAGGYPAALHPCPLFLVTFVLLILAEQSGDRTHGLLRVNLLVAACWLSSLHELGDCPGTQGVVLSRNASLIL